MSKWLLILIGTITWSLTMVKSGLIGEYGMGFWGPNGHDGIWHLALIEQLSQGSFSMPVFSGEVIKNYHLGFDLLLAGLHLITGISPLPLYFQIFPPLLAFLIGFLVYTFIFRWTQSRSAAWWSTFFIYFGGSLGWIVGGGESHFWAQQAVSTLVNPPFALSLVLLLLGLHFLYSRKIVFATFCFIILPHIKIYAGLLAFLGLTFGGTKDHFLWKVLVVSCIISLPLYFLINPGSQQLMVFQPGWFLESLFAPDRLNFPQFFSALNTYRVGHIWIKAIPSFFIAFLVFWIGNMGTRLLSQFILIKWLKSGHKITWIEPFIISIVLVGTLIPMFFIQKGTAWNTIQFFYYSLFFSSLLAGLTISSILLKIYKHKLIYLLSCVLIIISTLPTTMVTLGQYFPNRPPAKLAQTELEALQILSKQPRGVVLTLPYDTFAATLAIANPPRPLYLYESTAYVSAFSGKITFLADEVNLSITDYPWQARRKASLAFFEADQTDQINFLKHNSIRYLYLVGLRSPRLPFSHLDLLYQNTNIYLFSVKP